MTSKFSDEAIHELQKARWEEEGGHVSGSLNPDVHGVLEPEVQKVPDTDKNGRQALEQKSKNKKEKVNYNKKDKTTNKPKKGKKAACCVCLKKCLKGGCRCTCACFKCCCKGIGKMTKCILLFPFKVLKCLCKCACKIGIKVATGGIVQRPPDLQQSAMVIVVFPQCHIIMMEQCTPQL